MRQSSIFKEAGVAPDHFMPRQISLADPMTQWLYPASPIMTGRLLRQTLWKGRCRQLLTSPGGVNETRDCILQMWRRQARTNQHVPWRLFLDQFQKEGANLALALKYTRIHLLNYNQPAETQMD